MTETLSPLETAKFAAAKRACEFVESGMKLGLGTGSTADWFVKSLGELVAGGLRVTAVPTSTRTGDLARSLGINVVSLEEAKWLDLTVDGTDEFDPEFLLIKGGGGALLHEKVVATASERMIVIADTTKEVAALGAFPLPVEVIPFGWSTTASLIQEALPSLNVVGTDVRRRGGHDAPFRTDEGNFILDLFLGRIGDPRQLALVLNQIPGVVENGLFVDICDTVVIGHGNGTAEVSDLTGTKTPPTPQTNTDQDNIFSDIAD